jgi:MscS family membrane protein
MVAINDIVYSALNASGLSADAFGHIGQILIYMVMLGVGLYVVYRALFFLLKNAAAKTSNALDDLIVEKIDHPVLVFCAISTVLLAPLFVYPDITVMNVRLAAIYFALVLMNLAFFLDMLLVALLLWYEKEVAPKTESTLDDELLPMVRKVLRAAVYCLGALMALGNLGVEITPLLAGLGIASLAVALALQDSLGNFIAGINISLDRPLKKGDYISIDSGIEGEVLEIGWRSTKILAATNNVVSIPNTKLAQGIIVNYHKPDHSMVQTGTIGVSYKEDPDYVALVIAGAIRKAAEKSSALTKAEPIVRLMEFGDFALQFKYTYTAKNYQVRLNALDEANRAILNAFREAKIEIPYPTTVIHTPGRVIPVAEPERPPVVVDLGPVVPTLKHVAAKRNKKSKRR